MRPPFFFYLMKWVLMMACSAKPLRARALAIAALQNMQAALHHLKPTT